MNENVNICKKCLHGKGEHCPNPFIGQEFEDDGEIVTGLKENIFACVFYVPNNLFKYIVFTISRKWFYRIFEF